MKVDVPAYNDIDTDTTDEFAVAEYACEIFRNMKKREVLFSSFHGNFSRSSKIDFNTNTAEAEVTFNLQGQCWIFLRNERSAKKNCSTTSVTKV